MLSLGVAVNGAWSFKTQDESRRVRRKRSAARVLAALAHPRAYDRIDDSLVLESDLSDRRGQGEYEVEIGNGQEFGLAVRHPLRPRLPLTPWTVTIATGVVVDPRDAAVVAGFDMAAERRRPACRDRAYHAPLDAPEMCGRGAGVILAVA